MSSDEVRERPRLNLKPRDEAAVAKAAQARSSASKASPFGDAKPRESILATRTGQKEEDILKAELEKDKLKLRLTAEQNEQRQHAQESIAALEESLADEKDETRQAELRAEIESRQSKLTGLISEFERLAVERAKNGEGLRPSERRRLAEEREQTPSAGGFGTRGNYASEPSYSSPSGGGESFGSRAGRSEGFNRGYSRGGNRTEGSYDLNSNGGYRPAMDPTAEIGSGGYRSNPGAGQSGYNEPLAQGYDRTAAVGSQGSGRHPGSFDLFAGGTGGYSEVEKDNKGPSANMQDRF